MRPILCWQLNETVFCISLLNSDIFVFLFVYVVAKFLSRIYFPASPNFLPTRRETSVSRQVELVGLAWQPAGSDACVCLFAQIYSHSMASLAKALP